jgi:endonuclease/exonuclease/phosphatase family metal-dependent hydrolase
VTVRVATYNVRGFRSGVEPIAAVVNSLAPEILLLQETGSRRALGGFTRRVGMGASADPWSPFRRRVKNAVLARPPWRIDRTHLHRFEGSRRWYPRGALAALAVGDDDLRLWALSVHLGLDGSERGRHVEELLELVNRLAGEGPPVVVAGDLNATPDMRVVMRLAEGLRDCWIGADAGATFPSPAPSARIDYVFVSAGLRPVAGLVGGAGAEKASDHLPVAVDLEAEAG